MRWRVHLRQMKTKLIIRHKSASIIESSIFGTLLDASKRKYIAIKKPIIAYDVVAWYTPSIIKSSRKGVILKLRLIQGRTLRRITSAYKATFTKVLQVKTNVSLIDIHLEKLVQRLIAIMDVRESSKIIDATMLRIRNDLMSRRERKPKLRMISL